MAVLPAPVMTPDSKMLTDGVFCSQIPMFAASADEIEIVPVLVMPPEKVEIPSPPLEPTRIPFAAMMVPLLVMPLEKLEIDATWTPVPAAEISPVLVMPPEKVELAVELRLVFATRMPFPPADIVLVLVIPPIKLTAFRTPMAVPPAEIVPVLVLMMLPVKVFMPPPLGGFAPIKTAMPPDDDIKPLFVMPPEKVEKLPLSLVLPI